MAEVLRKEIQDLLAKEDFSKGLLELDDKSKVKEYFSVNGKIDLTDGEVEQLGQVVGGVMEEVAKLPEAELGRIAGGDGYTQDEYDAHFLEGVNLGAKRAEKHIGPRLKDAYNSGVKFGTDVTIERVGAQLPVIKQTSYTEGYDSGASDTHKTWGLGLLATTTLVGAGAGIYAIGKKKGWWSKR